MKRTFDLLLAILASVVLSPVILLGAPTERLTLAGLAPYWSDLVGWNNRIFKIPKFGRMPA